MKKTILGAALSVAVSVAPAYGQGHIAFSNYGATTDAIVTYYDAGSPGRPVTLFTAGLLYGLGNITDPALLTLSGITQFSNPAIPGYFTGPIVTIPDYTGGSITFRVIAYDGTDFASSRFRGCSELFTLPSIATGMQPVDEFGPSFKQFTVTFDSVCEVPEPGTVTLVGLGLVSLLIFRRQSL